MLLILNRCTVPIAYGPGLETWHSVHTTLHVLVHYPGSCVPFVYCIPGFDLCGHLQHCVGQACDTGGCWCELQMQEIIWYEGNLLVEL